MSAQGPTPLPPVPGGAGALAAGAVVHGRYRVERVLGQGGMGAVYLMRDANLAGRPCAMKELLDYSRNEQERAAAVRRFLAEAETLAALSAPGIPQVYDRFIEHGRYYLVMEFVAGIDLGRLAAHFGGPLPEREVVRWALQACDVLAYLHQFDPPVVHRDLKPANLLVVKGGRVKLVDFGIARTATGGRGTSLGTQGYAPPEQYRGELEPHSDLYALGASLHHLLSGRDPQQQAPFDFPPLALLVPDVNPDLATLVGQLLAMQPAERPASAEAVAAALLQAFPDINPYQARGGDARVDGLVLRLLDERPGSGALAARSGGGTAPLASPVGGTVPLASPAGGTVPLPPPAERGGTAPLASPAGGTVPLSPPQPAGRCPICGDPVHTWQRFCASCGVQVSGALPQLRLQGASADLALRVPPSYWQRGRIERVTFVDDAGPPGSGIIISVLAGDRAEYAYVARTETGALDGPALVGAPIQVFLHARQGEAPVLTALGPDPPDRVAEAIRLWQHWLSS